MLLPVRVRRVEVLEVLHEPRAVEVSVPDVACERGEPGSAEQAAAVTHRIEAALTSPVGKRRARYDDRAEQFGSHRREHHDRPAGLAVADHAWFALGLGVPVDNGLEKVSLGQRNVFDRLPRHGVRRKTHEVAGVSGLQHDADLAVRLEAGDAGAVTGARIDNDEGPQLRVDLHVLGRHDAHQPIVDGALQRAAVHDELELIAQHVRDRLRLMLQVAVPALTHHVPKQDATLRQVNQVVTRGRYGVKRAQYAACALNV